MFILVCAILSAYFVEVWSSTPNQMSLYRKDLSLSLHINIQTQCGPLNLQQCRGVALPQSIRGLAEVISCLRGHQRGQVQHLSRSDEVQHGAGGGWCSTTVPPPGVVVYWWVGSTAAGQVHAIAFQHLSLGFDPHRCVPWKVWSGKPQIIGFKLKEAP